MAQTASSRYVRVAELQIDPWHSSRRSQPPPARSGRPRWT